MTLKLDMNSDEGQKVEACCLDTLSDLRIVYTTLGRKLSVIRIDCENHKHGWEFNSDWKEGIKSNNIKRYEVVQKDDST